MPSVLHKANRPEALPPENNLAGHVAIVTGGAEGIGYQVSRALCRARCKVIIVNRNQEHSDAAVSQIKKESPWANVSWRRCDLGNLADTRVVFSALRRDLDRIDYLVLSAGTSPNQYQYAVDDAGIERLFAANYLGQYYAVNQLWPRIRKTNLSPGVTAPRIVAVSGSTHLVAPSRVKFRSLEDVNNPHLSPTELHGRARLALILLMRFGLFERVIKPARESIYALSIHPGAVNFGMQRQWKNAFPGITGTLISYATRAMSGGPEQGSYSTLWALTAREIEQKQLNGAYFYDPGEQGRFNATASDARLGADLWRLSQKLIKDRLGDDALLPWDASVAD